MSFLKTLCCFGCGRTQAQDAPDRQAPLLHSKDSMASQSAGGKDAISGQYQPPAQITASAGGVPEPSSTELLPTTGDTGAAAAAAAAAASEELADTVTRVHSARGSKRSTPDKAPSSKSGAGAEAEGVQEEGEVVSKPQELVEVAPAEEEQAQAPAESLIDLQELAIADCEAQVAEPAKVEAPAVTSEMAAPIEEQDGVPAEDAAAKQAAPTAPKVAAGPHKPHGKKKAGNKKKGGRRH